MQVLAQVALQRLIQAGVKHLKSNVDILDEIFEMYTCDELASDYGQTYIDGIKTWFTETKIPVVQAWSLNPERIPAVSIHLATENEDEGKASMGDFFGEDEDGEVGVNAFTVVLDVGIHASKHSDQVLWMYYIVSYILFKNKLLAEHLGLRLQTFSASDHGRRTPVLPDNVWSRWLKFKCTVQNTWQADPFLCIEDLRVNIVGIESAND